MKKLFFILVAVIVCAGAFAVTIRSQQQPVNQVTNEQIEPAIAYINEMWDMVMVTPSVFDELQDHDPDLVYHLVVENEYCTACKCRALLWCYKHSTNWDDTLGEITEADDLLSNIVIYYTEYYEEL